MVSLRIGRTNQLGLSYSSALYVVYVWPGPTPARPRAPPVDGAQGVAADSVDLRIVVVRLSEMPSSASASPVRPVK